MDHEKAGQELLAGAPDIRQVTDNLLSIVFLLELVNLTSAPHVV